MISPLLKIFKKAVKILLWIFLAIIVLLIGIIIALQFPKTQNFLTQKAVRFISGKTHSRVELGEINVAFPRGIVVRDLFLEDLNHDTLLYSHRLLIDVSMMKLLLHKIELNKIEIGPLTGHVVRSLPDSTFNFEFILQAFASKDSTPKKADTSKSSWEFSINTIALEKIFITFNDETAGSEMSFNIGHFKTRFKEFNLDERKFRINNITLDNTSASIIQTRSSSSTDTTSSSPIPYDIDVKDIDLSVVHLLFETPQQKLNVQIGKAFLAANKISLPNQNINLKEVSLKNSRIEFAINKQITVDTVAEKAKEAVTAQSAQERTQPWRITIKNFDLSQNAFVFDNFNAPLLKQGLDFNHLLLSGIEVSVKNVRYDEKNISADIHELKASDRSGFEIKHFQANVTYDSTHAELANFDLQTERSHIKRYLSIVYPSISAIRDSLAQLKVNVNLEGAVIGLNDLLLLQPTLADQLQIRDPEKQTIELTTKINGAVKDIHISQFELKAANNTSLRFSGTVKGLPEIQTAFFDIDIKNFSTTNRDVESLLKPEMLPSNIAVPAFLNVSASFKGYLKYFNSKLNLKSSFGDVLAEVSMKKEEVYQATVTADQFNVGQLLRDTALFGAVTANVKVNGSGLSTETMKGNADAVIQQAVFKNYNYHNISVNGNFKSKEFDGQASVNDSNIALSFDGLLNFDPQHPAYNVKLNLEGIDLQALHFTEEDLRVKGLLTADVKGNDLNNLNGTIDLRNVAITKNDTIYSIDSLLFVSISDTASKSIDIRAPFLTATFKGNIGIADLPAALTRHLNRYITFSQSDSTATAEAQNFTFNIELHNSDIYSVFIPKLKKFIPGTISGNFDSESHQLAIKANLPVIQYDNISVDSMKLNVNSDAQSLSYNVSSEKITMNDYQMLKPVITGKMENDSATIHFATSDQNDKVKYLIAGNVKKENSNYRFSFIHDSLILNYQSWSVTPDNYFVFGKEILYANHVVLTNGSQALKIESSGTESSSPLNVTFNDFQLSDLAHLVESGDSLLSGLLNGTVILKNLQTVPAFNADLAIDDFSFRQDTIGTVKVLSNNETENRYHAEVTVNGKGNDISVNGFYEANEKSPSINFDVNLVSVNLATFEAYTFGQATRMSGTLKGNLKVAGKPSLPDVNGTLRFSDAGFNLTYLTTYYRLNDEELTFTNTKATFNNFTLRDSLGATAVLNGYVTPDPAHVIAFDLSLQTKDFLALNSQKNDTAQFYGKVILDSYAKITGNKDFPKVSANLKLQDGSTITINKPREKVTNIESTGVVVFINRNDTLSYIMRRLKSDTSQAQAKRSELRGMDVDANIEINRNSVLTVVIDPQSGDSLRLQGDATLSFTLDASGKNSLTGRYEIAEGSYHLTFYDFVKRKFTLQQGGSLTWNGGLLEADVDLTAVYEVRTSPIDLVADQITDLSSEQKMTYQQRLPFQLYMNMKGELMKPDITFSLDLPPNERGAIGGSVYAKLNDLNQNEAELNKQVFALLLLNRFVAEDPLQSSQNNDVENVARNSVSQVLSQQLNRFASNYLKGVELNVNLQSYEDYSTGQPTGRTELQLGATKQLFNSRLSVQVGTNIELEGELAKQNTLTNIVGDVGAEYKITPEGTYRLRAYRRNDYDVLQGEVVETAFGIVFIKDYNRTRDLFKRSKEKQVYDKKGGEQVKPPLK